MNPEKGTAFKAIQAIDYTIIYVRDMGAMRPFYEDILGLALHRELSPDWIEYQIGPNTLTLANPKRTEAEAPIPLGSAALQLAFRVSVDDVDRCADELLANDIDLLSTPTNQDFGHRTLFFRDPDGNVLEIYAEI